MKVKLAQALGLVEADTVRAAQTGDARDLPEHARPAVAAMLGLPGWAALCPDGVATTSQAWDAGSKSQESAASLDGLVDGAGAGLDVGFGAGVGRGVRRGPTFSQCLC